MMQNELLTKQVSEIGEEITHELGAKFIKDYRTSNPNDVVCYTIGKNILDQVMAQPGCVGVRFYNAMNEFGEKTLVYVAVNDEGKDIMEFNVINETGKLAKKPAIVADRAQPSDNDGLWEWLGGLFS